MSKYCGSVQEQEYSEGCLFYKYIISFIIFFRDYFFSFNIIFIFCLRVCTRTT